MAHSAGGSSDVLRDLASSNEGKARPRRPAPPPPPAAKRHRDASPPPPPPPRPQAPPESRPTPPRTEASPQRVQQPARPAAPPAAPEHKPAARPTASAALRRPAAVPAGHDSLKAAAVPVFITVGTLLLIPMVWAILVLAGFDVWRSDWPGANLMAIPMLATGPIALCLYGGAWWMHTEVKRAKAAADTPRRRG